MSNKRLIAGLLAGAFLVMAGCSTTNPYTDEKETSNATKGAVGGAIAGALIGAMTGDRHAALKGAAIGGAVGGGAGYYMDVQEEKLRQRLRGTGVSVTRAGDTLILNMPGDITFRTGSSDLNAGFYQILDSVAIILKEYDDTAVAVTGHTDSVGSASSNQVLSERRAHSVASYLRSQGVGGQRFMVMGNGEQRPVASNTTKQGRSQNRRVEITLTPVNAR